jgi:transposase
LNGILYVLTTGCRWMDMPIKYGSYKTAWRRLKKWQDEGVWDKILKELASIGSMERLLQIARLSRLRKGGAGRIRWLQAQEGD